MFQALVMWVAAASVPATEVAFGTTGGRPSRVNTAQRSALSQAEAFAQKFGAPLLRIATANELEDALKAALQDGSFLREFVSIVSQLSLLDLTITPDIRDKFLDSAKGKLGGSDGALVAEGFAVVLESWERLPPELKANLTIELDSSNEAAMRESPELQDALEGPLLSLALGALFTTPLPLPPKPVQHAIVSRWFETNKKVLALVDPLQKQLDQATHEFPETTRSSLVRVAYTWDTDATEEPCLLVTIVLSDNAPEAARVVSGNLELIAPIAVALAGASTHVPFFLRVRLLSERP